MVVLTHACLNSKITMNQNIIVLIHFNIEAIKFFNYYFLSYINIEARRNTHHRHWLTLYHLVVFCKHFNILSCIDKSSTVPVYNL